MKLFEPGRGEGAGVGVLGAVRAPGSAGSFSLAQWGTTSLFSLFIGIGCVSEAVSCFCAATSGVFPLALVGTGSSLIGIERLAGRRFELEVQVGLEVKRDDARSSCRRLRVRRGPGAVVQS